MAQFIQIKNMRIGLSAITHYAMPADILYVWTGNATPIEVTGEDAKAILEMIDGALEPQFIRTRPSTTVRDQAIAGTQDEGQS